MYIKKPIKRQLLFILPVFIFLYSCEKNSEEEIIQINNQAINPLNDFHIESNNINGEIVSIKFRDTDIEVEKINNQYFYEGDIVIPANSNTPRSRSNRGVGRTTARWENNIVYYDINNDVPDQFRIFDAINHWEQNTPLRFFPKTNTTTDYITFQQGTGCSSNVGKIGGQQFITLNITCSTGNTIHEIGHAIGLWHEQSRKDRDQYITINHENIETGKEHNFRTYKDRFFDGEEYTDYFDFGSIMMYHPFAFSSNGLATITTINGDSNYPYQRNALSDGDIESILKMYPASTTNIGELPIIKNPSFSLKEPISATANSTCSCASWYNPNFPKQPGSSSESNDNPGQAGGGSIKLTYNSEEQRTAYQLIENVTPGTTYRLTFYYAIKNEGLPGALDFRVLTPNANSPATITNPNTIARYVGKQTENTNSIRASNGGGQIAQLAFTPTTNQIALYAVNSVKNSSDVRIDNFSIEILRNPTSIPEIKNPTFSLKEAPFDAATYTCSCSGWYNGKFAKAPGSSTDSNDNPGSQQGGSIKLTYQPNQQRTAYQLLNDVTPGVTYKLRFYYAIKNLGTIGELDFRVLTPNATSPQTVTKANTIAQYIGKQTGNTNSIKSSLGGGQFVELEFTATTNQVALYAVNAVENGSDVRIDNFSIVVD